MQAGKQANERKKKRKKKRKRRKKGEYEVKIVMLQCCLNKLLGWKETPPFSARLFTRNDRELGQWQGDSDKVNNGG